MISHNSITTALSRPAITPTSNLLLCLLLGLATAAHAQEAIRMSWASATAAEERNKAASTLDYYNLKAGPMGWNFGAGLDVEYDDNVQLRADGASLRTEDDVIFRPQINTRMLWPVTDQNSLNLALGGGYSVYAQHSDLDRFFVNQGSELSFDIYAGDFWINLHDRFSIMEDSFQDPTVAGNGGYSQLQNAAGASVLWDLNKVILKSGYDHVNYVAVTGSQGRPDEQSEVLSTSAGYALKPGTLLGAELGGALIDYSGAGTSAVPGNAKQWNAGGFYETQISEYVHFRGSVGYTVYSPDGGGSPGITSDFSGVYAQAAITHRVNRYVAYTLSGGRTISSGLFGGTVDLDWAQLRANWKIIRKVDVSTSFNYNHGSQVNAGTEKFDQYGAGVSFGRPITAKLSGSLGYQYYWRGSDVAGRDYTVNLVNLNLAYRF